MGCSGSKFVGPYDSYDWNELPDNVKEAAKVLGYNKKAWNNDARVLLEDNEWEELTTAQREAATVIGYDQKTWDAS